MSEQRGDPEINETIDRCNQALARTMEGIVRRENLLYHLQHEDPHSAINQDRITKHLEQEGLSDASLYRRPQAYPMDVYPATARVD